MDILQAFPSNYIKSSDLAGQTVPVVISHCAMEKFDDGDSPILFFQERQKGLVLNKTNATVLADAFGNETDQWPGHPVELYAAETSYMGKPCMGVRVRITNAAAAPVPVALPSALEVLQPAPQATQPVPVSLPTQPPTPSF